MGWPQTIEVAIESIQSADLLSLEQKRDVFYNNAARFLRLSEEEIARHHHGKQMRTSRRLFARVLFGALLSSTASIAAGQQPTVVEDGVLSDEALIRSTLPEEPTWPEAVRADLAITHVTVVDVLALDHRLNTRGWEDPVPIGRVRKILTTLKGAGRGRFHSIPGLAP